MAPQHWHGVKFSIIFSFFSPSSPLSRHPVFNVKNREDSFRKFVLFIIVNRTKYFEMMGRKGGIHWRVADKAERSNTVFVVQVNNSQGFGLLTREVGEV